MALSQPVISLGTRKIAVDLPHFVFVTVIAAWCVWFCRDAWLAQASIENLIMIVPASGAAAVLYVFAAASCFSVSRAEDPAPTRRRALGEGVAVKLAGTMALLAAFVVAGPLIGFDIASFVYILATLLLLGERRIIVLLLVPALFCIVAIYGFDTILTTPLPLFFFTGDAS